MLRPVEPTIPPPPMSGTEVARALADLAGYPPDRAFCFAAGHPLTRRTEGRGRRSGAACSCGYRWAKWVEPEAVGPTDAPADPYAPLVLDPSA